VALRTTIVAPALIGAALLSAAPATADDDTFVGALEMLGLDVEDPAAVVAMGRSVCADFDAGATLPAVVDRLSADRGLSIEDASLVAGFSVAEYCDQHEDALHGG
jgi:hypothetical protein